MKGYLRNHLFWPTMLLVLASFSYADKGPKPLKVGKTAPLQDYAMNGIDGSSATLKSLKGDKGLLVVFSCNTCPFVVGAEKFPGWEVQYNPIHDLALSNGVKMVLINSNEAKRGGDDAMDAMKKRAEEKGYTMPYLVDTDSKLADAFGARTTPHVYLFDSGMKLVYTGSIDNTWDSKRTEDIPHLKNALTSLGKGEKIKAHTTDPRGCSIKRKQ
jgi:peroxiredoxin